MEGKFFICTADAVKGYEKEYQGFEAQFPSLSEFKSNANNFAELIAKPLGEKAAKLVLAIRIHEGKSLSEPFTTEETQYALNIIQGYAKRPQWMEELNNKKD